MTIRVATFNASLNRNAEGQLITDLSDTENSQAQSVAEIIQRTDADVILVNEFDFDAEGEAARLFQENYLGVSQNGQTPVDYPYVFVAPSNTGVPTGLDLDNSGAAGDFAPGDAQGFGFFEGQFGFIILSKHPIDEENVRTFQNFLWKDMPGALLPADPEDADGNGDTENWYTEEELAVLRLSSKNHVDLPVLVEGETVHILAAHPTPPVFDGPEDRNGTRNHDEIRFWSDYVDGADYIYDDNGQTGGLGAGERFVIVGDYNADPFDGDSTEGAINQLLENPNILGSATDPAITPSSEGGVAASEIQAGFNETHIADPAFDTADFGFAGFTDGVQNPDNAPGNLRVDYALPSTAGLAYLGGDVFWQAPGEDPFPLAEFPTSDHRLVSVDLRLTNDNRATVEGVDFLGVVEIESGTEFEDTTLGGLSGIVLDPVSETYIAISDDFGTTVPNRFYELSIDLSDGSLDDGDVEVLEVVQMDPNGVLPGFGTADTEGVAIGQGGQLYISTERNNEGRFPQILEVSRDGTVTGELPVDDKFNGTDDQTGVRNNLGFESLTISPDQTTMYVATEGALTQDGPRAGLENTSTARIVEYDAATGEAVAEYVYEVDPIAEPPNPEGAFADSGLVELLAIDDQGTLLALERSFSVGAEERGYTGKLYLVSTRGATNVIGVDSLPFAEDDGEVELNVDETVTKTLLADLGADFGIVVDNIEGMTLGPVLEDGRQSLIIASDDNFSAFGPQANQFVALALDLGEVPTITPALETPDELRYPGPAPIVIAHRGASGDRPEHTLAAYQKAMEDGADFIEPDLVSTSDGVLIARHEPWLATVETDESGEVVLDDNGDPVITFASTDIADVAKTNPDFLARLTTKNIGFSSEGLFGPVTGWFAEDFTLEEIKTLRAVEDQPELRPQSAAFDGQFEIPTLEEIIQLVQAFEEETGEQVGIYPETKEPSYFDSIGLSLEENLIQTLIDTGFTDPDRVFIQSFEVANLLDLQETVMPEAGVDLPLVQLLFNAPTFPTFDLVNEALTGGDFSAYESLGFDASTVSGDLFSPEGLALLADVYAEGIGPSLSLVFSQPGLAVDDPTVVYSDLVDTAQDAGLVVHAYTHRVESNISLGLEGEATPEETLEAIFGSGIDGLFTDNTDVVVPVVEDLFGTEGPDPDDPAIWEHPTRPGRSTVITAMKDGGLRVYDLEGNEIQRIEKEGVRYNNVDIMYGVRDSFRFSDIAVVSDRANDSVAFFRIKKDGTLQEVTARKAPASIFGVDDGEATAYGVTGYTSPIDGKHYVFVTQADGSQIAQLELKVSKTKVNYEVVRVLDLPVPEGEDPADYQAEGITIDRETGIGYVAVEEELGLLSFEAEPNGSDGFKTIAPIEDFEPDLEGVSIYYGDNGDGLIIVSSQGDATFRVYDREDHRFLGSFAIRGEGDIDGVEESDGAEIFSGALPGFPDGLLVTQDGSNEIEVVFPAPDDGEIQNWNANFKYTDLAQVLDLFGQATNPDFDPRNLTPQTLPNGVASGDMTEDSIVLWTRSIARGDLTFTVVDPRSDEVVAEETVTVDDPATPVKVKIDGLAAGTQFVYSVEDAAGATAEGTFTTAFEDGFNGLAFGVTGDWRGELAPYPAISNVAELALDWFLVGGDTIYADFESPVLPGVDQAATVEEFRTKYSEVYGSHSGENFWAELRASTPIYATIDDHEVTNDFAGGSPIGETAETEFADLFPEDDPEALVNDSTLYENGLQAFQDYHPIEDIFYGDTGDDRTSGERELYRSQQFGQDAAVMILDQRSFRDEQIDGVIPGDTADIARFQTESFNPERTLLGAEQLADLKADLLEAEASGVTWKFVYSPEPIQDLGLNNADSWEGYKAERTEILKFINDNDIDNVVFIAADIHATFVNNLTYSEEPLGEQIATSAFEITTGSVAFDPTFGPAVIGAIAGTPLLPPEQEAFYNSLPIAPDGDGLLNDKDDFIREAFNSLAIDPLGLDPLGLDDNLEQAEGLIDATLLQGGWVSAHTFGWTEFLIDDDSQTLSVTTFGIPGYGVDEAGTNTDLEPQIVSQFLVRPELDDQVLPLDLATADTFDIV